MTSLAIIFKNGYITVFSSRVTFHLNCKTKLIGETVVSLLNRLVFGALLRMDCAVNKGTIYIYILYVLNYNTNSPLSGSYFIFHDSNFWFVHHSNSCTGMICAAFKSKKSLLSEKKKRIWNMMTKMYTNHLL